MSSATGDIETFRARRATRSKDRHVYVSLLGLRTYGTRELHARVEAGFSYQTFERLRKNMGLSQDRFAKLVQIPARTLSRRKAQGKLRPDESDRLLRVSRVFAKALDLFEGDSQAARSWLTTPQPALGGDLPVDFATTDVGVREVENLIGRLEHGIVA